MSPVSPKSSISTLLLRTLLVMATALVLIVILIGTAFLIADKSSGRITSSGETRSYLLYVPKNYDPLSPTPLVIGIHGFADWPAHLATVSRWNNLAEENGFIVVYPSGTRFPKRWRTLDSPDSAIDVQFISDLVDKLEQDYSIDPARIYINGFSNGGGMSVLLACKRAERFAAIASVAGAYTYPLDQCAPKRPVPLIAFHGTADPVVPYLGGAANMFKIPFPVVSEWVQSWAKRNQCLSNPVVLPLSGEVSGIRYTKCAQNADVDFYIIEGGGHAWPGGGAVPAWIVGYTSQQIDTTRLIWEFFKAHPLPTP
ncbi:MAG: alpha/beta hydrolase-fold protein [Chloroflexi bacterium]|nr:alpha/beta hydrolase-fold protein [Chloroflexota bacterium]